MIGITGDGSIAIGHRGEVTAVIRLNCMRAVDVGGVGEAPTGIVKEAIAAQDDGRGDIGLNLKNWPLYSLELCFQTHDCDLLGRQNTCLTRLPVKCCQLATRTGIQVFKLLIAAARGSLQKCSTKCLWVSAF